MSSRSGNQRHSLYLKVSKRNLKHQFLFSSEAGASLALCTNLISVSALSRKKPAPYILFYFLEAGKESGFVAVGLSRSVGARRGVPYVVLPGIASTEAFFISYLGTHGPPSASSCCPPVVCSSSLHQLSVTCKRRRFSYIGDSLEPRAGIGVCSSASVAGLGIVNFELLSTFLSVGRVIFH